MYGVTIFQLKYMANYMKLKKITEDCHLYKTGQKSFCTNSHETQSANVTECGKKNVSSLVPKFFIVKGLNFHQSPSQN